jgi:phospholipid/cholesterol/gamma-HCH transport system substrate-binding protein
MSDKHTKDLTIEVLVGFFMFIILIALGIFTIVLSRQNFFQKTYPVEVFFEEIGGLREGDNVLLRGTKVGSVKATMLEKDHVAVRANLEVPIEFREGYKVEVLDSSMLGGKVLKIDEGPLNAPPVPEGEPIIGTPPVNIIDELGVAVSGIKDLTERVASGHGTLGKLIQDESVYDHLQEIMTNLQVVSDRLANGKGTLGKLLSDDDRLYRDLQDSMAYIRSISGKIDSGEGTLGKLIADDQVYEDLRASLAGIHEIANKINSGEGTLGKLVTDDQVYVEAQKLLEDLRAAIDDMRETSPVTTFSTIFFGAF